MSHGLTRRNPAKIEGWGLSMSDIAHGDAGTVDPRVLFEDSQRPLEIEVGSGKGTFLVQEAAREPATNFLGIEWAKPFFRFAADRTIDLRYFVFAGCLRRKLQSLIAIGSPRSECLIGPAIGRATMGRHCIGLAPGERPCTGFAPGERPCTG